MMLLNTEVICFDPVMIFLLLANVSPPTRGLFQGTPTDLETQKGPVEVTINCKENQASIKLGNQVSRLVPNTNSKYEVPKHDELGSRYSRPRRIRSLARIQRMQSLNRTIRLPYSETSKVPSYQEPEWQTKQIRNMQD